MPEKDPKPDSAVHAKPATASAEQATSADAPPEGFPPGRPGQPAPAAAKHAPKSQLEGLPETPPEGLSEEQARQRLERFGYNELAEERLNPVLKFLTYFWGPIPWMIEAAAGLSAVVQHWSDFSIIMALLIANAVVGFWEEYQAGNAIQALKKKLALEARVKRGARWRQIPARELVPGDLIRLRLGDIVPADAKLLEGDPVEVDQSALTGESLPVTRETGQTVYSGSILRQGESDAAVSATGANTYFGKTAELVESAKTTSHFQKAVLKIGNYLIVLAGVLVASIVVVGLLRGEHPLTIVRFALVLTVAAIPVAMPTVLSVTMAVGARLLARKQAIVSRLAAVEELAGIDVLCSDKTGTLTQNKLKLGEPFAIEGVQAGQIVLAGALASREEDEDPIDLAVIKGLGEGQDTSAYSVIHFTPFDPVHKRTEAKVKDGGGEVFRVTKGAPQVILEMAENKDQVRSAVEEAVNKFAARGFRSLGVARAEGEEGPWRFLGVLPLYDPPREDSRVTVETAQEMGVKVRMVTGDQLAIAKEIARQLDLGTDILDAKILVGDKEQGRQGQQQGPSKAELTRTVEKADGFAQVFPEHKFHIVEALQSLGHIVGMTGDGVNDAPALKKADAGIAVSGSTDAARAAADIVLLQPGLSVIVDAIKEARRIFQRMNSYAVYRITETIRVLFFVTASILVFRFYPVTAIMIVLLAILNDGAILSIAFDRARWSHKPRAWHMRGVLGIATMLGTMGVIETFGLFYLADRVFHVDRQMIQSLIYLKLSVSGHLTIFVTRTRWPFWSYRPSTALLAAVVGTQALATLIVVGGLLMPAIPLSWAAMVWGYALAWFLVEDRLKLAGYRLFEWLCPGAVRQEEDGS